MARKKNPNSNPKSGGIGFAVTALLLSSLTGFSFGGILVGVLVGLGIGKITSIMGSGLDTTTHNKEDEERRRREAEEEARRIKAEEERKALVAERDSCGPLKVVTVVTLTKQITTLTEDIEELKSKKNRILAKLGCADDKEALAAEKRMPELEKTRDRLKAQQEKLPTQANAAAGEYIRAENAVPAERWNQVIEQRKLLFIDHLHNLIEKLKEIYGQRFNREIYDDARRYVNDHIPERKRVEIDRDVSERAERDIDPMIERQRPRNRRRNDNVL